MSGTAIGDGQPSTKLRELALGVEKATTREERLKALKALVTAYLQEYDPGDHELLDDWHSYVEEYQRAKLEFEQATARLGRLLAHSLSAHAEALEAEGNPDVIPLNRRSGRRQ